MLKQCSCRSASVRGTAHGDDRAAVQPLLHHQAAACGPETSRSCGNGSAKGVLGACAEGQGDGGV